MGFFKGKEGDSRGVANFSPDSKEIALEYKRLLVFGNRVGGAFDIQSELAEYLRRRGISTIQIEVVRDASSIDLALRGTENSAKLAGVIVLPEMRDYAGGFGRDVSTDGDIRETVSEFCNEQDIPMVRVERNETKNGFQTSLAQIVSSNPHKS